MPIIDGIDGGEDFELPRRIIQLSAFKRARAERDRLEALAVILKENGADVRGGGVGGDGVGASGVGDNEGGGRRDEVFDSSKSGVSLRAPITGDGGVLSQEGVEGLNRFGIVLAKLP